MTAIYDIMRELETLLITDGICNQVSAGDLSELALQKQTVYPYAHIVLGNVDMPENLLTFNVSIICMEVVDVSKSDTTDLVKGNDNEQDALNTTLGILSRLVEKLRRGDIRESGYHLSGTPTAEPFLDDYADKVAGWVLTLAFDYRNNMDKC